MLFDSQTTTAEIERIRAMKMSEFSQAGSWAKIASDLFPHSEIYLASDPKAAREVKKFAPNAVIYGPGELARIMALGPDEEMISQIHRAKAILGGRVITTTPKEAEDE
mgnify:CR=1 FL=1